MIILRNKAFNVSEKAYKFIPKKTLSREFFFKRGLNTLEEGAYRNTIPVPEFTGRVLKRGRKSVKDEAATSKVNKSIEGKIAGKWKKNKRVIKDSRGDKNSPELLKFPNNQS